MSLEQITRQLNEHSKGLPPVELWNPPYCGEIDITIKTNGDWFYNGTIFKRLPLVKLFASVLIKEVEDSSEAYFLVTPVEKVKISVEEAPFVLTQWCWLDDGLTVDEEKSHNNSRKMKVSTNLGDEFLLDAEHPLTINENGDLYVTVRRNLTAKVHRNIYYQWAEIASEQQTEKGTELVINSSGCTFSLGVITES
ncbi:DUF1285 domain-containing protein [Colwellia echini]|uniref:DUF1285 domain-containing protein n=1 Tax=Colwellia echini TaxID=1982103 RepID=A0ABY3N1H9_9GAMM|nr:DUF1285 domain-containing protein [Colwellia echini]TYK67087.1 DUF1285 domain-containing protein [Colwellia echini]